MKRPGPSQITPQVEKELRRRMAAGEPLPPGFHAVPEGQAPPPGVTSTGVVAQNNGQPIDANADLTARNPMLAGPETLTAMRNKMECPLPVEQMRLQKNIQAVIGIKGHDREIEETIATGLAVSLRVNSYCETQLQERVMVDFTKTPELDEMTQQIVALTDDAESIQKQLEALHQQLQEVAKKAQGLIEKRWDTAVAANGLDPAKNAYRMSDDDTQIIDMRLDCNSCKGKARARKARQSGEELLQRIAQEQKTVALKSVGLAPEEPTEPVVPATEEPTEPVVPATEEPEGQKE